MDFLSFENWTVFASSPYVVAALLIAALSALFLYFFKDVGTPLRIGLWALTVAAIGGAIFGAALLANADPDFDRRETPRTYIEGRGFYEDIENAVAGEPMVFRPAHEDLRLGVYQDGFIDGQSGGTVVQAEGDELSSTDKTWRQAGYISGDMLFLSYQTNTNNDQLAVAPGIGAYVLQQQGQNYVGRLVFWDSRFRVTLDCPYLLATGATERLLSDEAALERWPFLRGGCRQVSFSP